MRERENERERRREREGERDKKREEKERRGSHEAPNRIESNDLTCFNNSFHSLVLYTINMFSVKSVSFSDSDRFISARHIVTDSVTNCNAKNREE